MSSFRRIALRAFVATSCIAATAGAQSRPSVALTLDAAIEMALQQGPNARAVTHTREAARWRDRAFHARLLPQLSVRGDLPIYRREIVPVLQPDGSQLFVAQELRQSTLSMQVSQQLPFTGGEFFITSGLSNVNTIGQQSTKLWRSTPFVFGLRQTLFRPNTLAWDSREQDARLEVAERQFIEQREDIASRTAGLYFDLFAARTALVNAEANASVNDTLFTVNKGRYEVGRIGENDLLQSELQLLRARTRLDGARLAVERAEAALRLHLGLPPDAAIELQVTNEIPTVNVDTATAIRHALQNSAQVKELELQNLQQKRRVNEARRSTGIAATITAGMGYNQSAATFNDAYRAPLQSQNFSVALEMPLLQWGARSSQIQAALADEERVATDAKLARDQRAQDVAFAVRGLEQAARQLEIAAKADSVGAKRFEVARNRYVIGRIDISNLFIAQNEKDQALEAYVAALRGYWEAYYRLRRLTLYDFVNGRPL